MFPRLSRLPNRSKKQLIHTNRRWLDGKNLSLSLWEISLFTPKCIAIHIIYYLQDKLSKFTFHRIWVSLSFRTLTSITYRVLNFIHFLNLSPSLETIFPSFCPNISSVSIFVEFEFALNTNYWARVGLSLKFECLNALSFQVLSISVQALLFTKVDSWSSEMVHIWGYDCKAKMKLKGCRFFLLLKICIHFSVVWVLALKHILFLQTET